MLGVWKCAFKQLSCWRSSSPRFYYVVCWGGLFMRCIFTLQLKPDIKSCWWLRRGEMLSFICETSHKLKIISNVFRIQLIHKEFKMTILRFVDLHAIAMTFTRPKTTFSIFPQQRHLIQFARHFWMNTKLYAKFRNLKFLCCVMV